MRCFSTPWDIYPAVNKLDELMKAYRILGGLNGHLGNIYIKNQRDET
jgi:hypothetical protein